MNNCFWSFFTQFLPYRQSKQNQDKNVPSTPRVLSVSFSSSSPFAPPITPLVPSCTSTFLLSIPVLVRIHSSLVSWTVSKSKLVMVVTGEEEPIPIGRTVRGPPDARRAVSGDWGDGRRKEVLWGRRSVARSSFILMFDIVYSKVLNVLWFTLALSLLASSPLLSNVPSLTSRSLDVVYLWYYELRSTILRSVEIQQHAVKG